MSSVNRLDGGLIDRSQFINFSFDGKSFQGHPGDTLASALTANGIRLLGRSFKYHRPRGLFSAGSEEPNGLVQLRKGAFNEPNTRATTIELFDGLEAESQNRGFNVKFDPMAINDFMSPFLAAGFYYKTFMWPKAFWEKLYEPIIRKAAGLGHLSMLEDPDQYDKGSLHCDLLIIGAGPSGLASALAAGRAGLDVVLCDEDFRMGGRLLADKHLLKNQSGSDWSLSVCDELQSLPNVRLMTRTTVFGAYDHGVYGAVERNHDHVGVVPDDKPRQTVWRIYSKSALLCTGATERPITFDNNDRPGVMMAGSMRAYVNRWAATPGKSIVVFASHDDGHQTAVDLLNQGVNVAAVVDPRVDAPQIGDYKLMAGAQVVNTSGRLGVKSVKVRIADGTIEKLDCDAVAVSGGWNPNVHLTCHQRGRPKWQDDIAAFVPGGELPVGMQVAGAAAGDFSTSLAMRNGVDRVGDLLEQFGKNLPDLKLPDAEGKQVQINPFWHVDGQLNRAWLDQQNDVTVKDVRLAHKEGFKSVELLKRYTTLGMATDQGKTANLGAMAILSELDGRPIFEVGTTMFRPPYTPVSLGALAGRSRGKNFRPTRLTPSHLWAEENGAEFVEVGNWLRAQWFVKPGEKDWRQSVDREVLGVRKSVGVCDVTTLGKVDVQGPDAATFLNRIYCNPFAKVAVGKVRYGLMLREDGFAMDDGTAARLSENHFVVTTTTANAVPVFRHMEFCRQCLWPDLDVQLISTTEAWAQFAVAGPNSRNLLRKIVDPEHDISNDGFPYMGCKDISVCGGLRARLFRISFSGELAFEIAVPTRYGDALIRRLMEAGDEFDVTPYGTEALGVLRIEKGHAAGNELNGQTTAAMLGLGRMVSAKKDSIGRVLSERDALQTEGDLRQVGLVPVDADKQIMAGAHLMNIEGETVAQNDQGWVSSAAYSPHVGSSIGLAFLKSGDQRQNEFIRVVNPLDGTAFDAKVVSSHFVDPDGERLRD